MIAPRHLAIAAVLAAAALLAGCTGGLAAERTPLPTPTVEALPPEEVEALLVELLPAAPEGFATEERRGLDTPSVGSDWTDEDYDASRIARAGRSFQSPGWSDADLGPAFVCDVEIMVLSTPDGADRLLTDLAASARTPFEDTEEGARIAYSPLPEPTGLWPFGSVEYVRDVTWPTGEHVSGRTAFSADGPVVLMVSWLAVPESQDAAAAHVAALAPALVDGVAMLPDRLVRAR